MSRPTDGLRAEIAQSVREMPDDILLALVAHHVQPKRGRRPKVDGDEVRALAGLLASETRRADAAEADAAHYRASLNGVVSTGFQDRASAERLAAHATQYANQAFHLEAVEEQVVKLKAQVDGLTSPGLELLTRAETAEKLADRWKGEFLVEREHATRMKQDCALIRGDIDATRAEGIALGRALEAASRPPLTRYPFALIWKAGAREMKARWDAAILRENAAKPTSRLMVPTDPEACERAKLASGAYEREPDDEDTEEPDDLPKPAPNRAPSHNTGGPLFGDGRKARR